MKRIISIDVLRGFAIILMTIVHTWTNVADLSEYYNQDFASLTLSLRIVVVIFFFLGHSRTMFLFISALIYQYNFMKSLKKGKNPERLLYRGIVKGLIVYMLGILREGIFSPWGTINNLILHGNVSPSNLRLGYIFETLQIIGLSIIFLSVTNYILFKLKLEDKSHVFFIVYALYAVGFIFPAPYIHVGVTNFLGYDITSMSAYTRDFLYPAEYFTRFFWQAIAGVENPIFPNFGVTSIGGIMGYFLAKPNVSKKFLGYSFLAGTILIIWGLQYWIFVDNMYFDIKFRIHPTWYILINMGLQIYYVVALLALFEFRTKANMKRYVRFTRFIRRWSIIALSVYMYQFLDVFIRMLMTSITGIEFTILHQQQLGLSIAMTIVSYIFFDAIIRIWEKLRFFGTWEWILIQFVRLFAGRKHYNSARIKVKETIYDVEPISFVEKEALE